MLFVSKYQSRSLVFAWTNTFQGQISQYTHTYAFWMMKYTAVICVK